MLKPIIKKILPSSVLNKLIDLRYHPSYVRFSMSVDRFFLPFLSLLSKTRITSALYYLFLNGSFRREMQSVLAGKVAHTKTLNSIEGNLYQLKRNIHRVEKGLIMKSRRKVFALDYIEATVQTYISLVQVEGDLNSDPGILKWASDVLSEYFRVVERDTFLEKLYSSFQLMAKEDTVEKKIPYKRDLTLNPVKYEDFLTLTHKRRSVRWYQDKLVDRELIEKALLAANQAPSACNRQPFKYMIFSDPDKVQQLATIPKGTPGYSHNIQSIAVIVGDLSAYFNERDRHVIYIDASLSAMSFILALETLGVSSCCINWPDVEKLEKKMAKLLNLKQNERPIMLVSMGYPDEEGLVPFSQKKSKKHLRSMGDE